MKNGCTHRTQSLLTTTESESPRRRLAILFLVPVLLACLTVTPTPEPLQLPAPERAIPPAPSPQAAMPDPAPRCARVTTSALHVRASPMGQVTGWLTLNMTLTVQDDSANWWRVRAPQAITADGKLTDLTGYVHAAYLQEAPCLPQVHRKK